MTTSILILKYYTNYHIKYKTTIKKNQTTNLQNVIARKNCRKLMHGIKLEPLYIWHQRHTCIDMEISSKEYNKCYILTMHVCIMAIIQVDFSSDESSNIMLRHTCISPLRKKSKCKISLYTHKKIVSQCKV